MVKRLVFVSVVCAVWAGMLAVAVAACDPAPAGCATTHIVQRGDTLRDLAKAYGVPLSELLQANQSRIRDPNMIYVGQVLCIPGIESGTVWTPREMAFEATYHFALDDSEKGWNLTTRGGLVGKEAAYLITETDFFSTTEELLPLLQSAPAPVLMAYRNGDDAITYTLVAIGDARIVTSLALTDSIKLEDLLPTIPRSERVRIEASIGGRLEDKLPAAQLNALIAERQTMCIPVSVGELGLGRTEDVNLTVMLRNADGVYFPFEVTDIAWRPNIDEAIECYKTSPDLVGFLLFPASSGLQTEYRAVMRLSSGVIGPPGITRALRCSYWPRGGWFYRWLRGWFGCR